MATKWLERKRPEERDLTLIEASQNAAAVHKARTLLWKESGLLTQMRMIADGMSVGGAEWTVL